MGLPKLESMSDHKDHSFWGRFPDLDEMNYHTWSYSMKMQLIWKDLWGIVNREVTQPISNVQAQTAWDWKNWDRLWEIHQSGSFGDHFDLNCQLWTTKYDPDMESGTLQSHINGMMNVTQQLNSLGSQVPEETQVIAILGSLPSDYCMHMTIGLSHVTRGHRLGLFQVFVTGHSSGQVSTQMCHRIGGHEDWIDYYNNTIKSANSAIQILWIWPTPESGHMYSQVINNMGQVSGHRSHILAG